jgi:hypothetical protein
VSSYSRGRDWGCIWQLLATLGFFNQRMWRDYPKGKMFLFDLLASGNSHEMKMTILQINTLNQDTAHSGHEQGTARSFILSYYFSMFPIYERETRPKQASKLNTLADFRRLTSRSIRTSSKPKQKRPLSALYAP